MGYMYLLCSLNCLIIHLRTIFKIFLLGLIFYLEILKWEVFESSYCEDCNCYEMRLLHCKFPIVWRPQCRF